MILSVTRLLDMHAVFSTCKPASIGLRGTCEFVELIAGGVFQMKEILLIKAIFVEVLYIV